MDKMPIIVFITGITAAVGLLIAGLFLVGRTPPVHVLGDELASMGNLLCIVSVMILCCTIIIGGVIQTRLDEKRAAKECQEMSGHKDVLGRKHRDIKVEEQK